MDNQNYNRVSGGRDARRPAQSGRYTYRRQQPGRYADRQQPGSRTSPPQRNRTEYYDPDSMDRYNYVDRDIYSSSATERRHGGKPPKKKGGCAKKFFTLLLCLLLIGVGGGFIYFHVMASRLNRSGNVNSATLARYVQQPAAAPAWGVKSDSSVMNILLLGIDENKDGSDGRSDSNMLVSVDSKSKKMRLVSFLRDSYLQIPTIGKNKLNAAYANGGVALTMQTLENNYRVNIDRYVSVNFNNFAAVIDKMGGLDVPMSTAACKQENENIHTNFKKGTNHLNGKQCLYYARIRDASDDFGHDDYGRAGRQRQVIELMINKIKKMNLLQSSKIMYDYLPYVKTNLNDAELAYLASVGATLSSYKTETQQMPAPGTFDDQRDVTGIGTVIDLDLKKNCTILRQFLYGDASSSQSGN
jgi:LCP family protein required for cell wall assembly